MTFVEDVAVVVLGVLLQGAVDVFVAKMLRR